MVRPRSIPLCIVLSIITCGIYFIYWFVCVTDDVNEVTQEYDTSGIVAFCSASSPAAFIASTGAIRWVTSWTGRGCATIYRLVPSPFCFWC